MDDKVIFVSSLARCNIGPLITSRFAWRLMSMEMFCFLSTIGLFHVWTVNPSMCYFLFVIGISMFGLLTLRCASMNIKYAYELF